MNYLATTPISVNHKDKMLNALSNEWEFLTLLAKKLNIQYYQSKMVMYELIGEKKAQAQRFGCRIKYRRTPKATMPQIVPN